MSVICLTGASGFLGREMLNVLSADHKVIGLTHRTRAPHLVPCDVREATAFTALLRDLQPDVVVNCAAYRDPDVCEAQPEETHRLNVAPVQVLAETLPPQARLVQISTDYVFDGEHPPYREDSPTCPVNVYGETKRQAEHIALTRNNSLVLRIPLLVGAGPTLQTSGFIAQILDALTSGQPQEADEVQLRFPTWTRDVARAVSILLRDEVEGVMHFSSTEGLTRYRIMQIASDITGHSAAAIRPTQVVAERRAPRPANSQLAIDRWLNAGYPPPATFADIFRQTLTDFGVPHRG